MNEIEKLKNLVLAPYIIKATALIGIRRGIGGNQFRHALATMAILLDYKYYDNYVLLKAAVIQYLFEDVPETAEHELRSMDEHANEVVDLVKEVTRPELMSKEQHLKNILEKGSRNAKILKVAERISNLADLHIDCFTKSQMVEYLNLTEKYVLPMAIGVNENMAIELNDLIRKRRKQINSLNYPVFLSTGTDDDGPGRTN
jgi:(p)ppGpp synthase/HD superfamily hydrolase